MSTDGSQPTDTNAPRALIHTIIDRVAELSAIMEAEFVAMNAGSADELVQLVARKEQVVQQIASHESSLAALFNQLDADADPLVVRLKQDIRNCHALNQASKVSVQVRLSHARKALELLRSLLHMNDVAAYGAAGEMTVSREKRDFGTA